MNTLYLDIDDQKTESTMFTRRLFFAMRLYRIHVIEEHLGFSAKSVDKIIFDCT